MAALALLGVEEGVAGLIDGSDLVDELGDVGELGPRLLLSRCVGVVMGAAQHPVVVFATLFESYHVVKFSMKLEKFIGFCHNVVPFFC